MRIFGSPGVAAGCSKVLRDHLSTLRVHCLNVHQLHRLSSQSLKPRPPTMLLKKRNSSNESLCLACGGRCCQGSPGIWVDPERFFALFFPGERLTVEALRQRLPAAGLVLWENSGVPIPAPRSLASGCAFLGAGGCGFSIGERPCQCLALIPDEATLDQPRGCLCRTPAAFSRAAGRARWREYWLAARR
jgi:hypothetical protein